MMRVSLDSLARMIAEKTEEEW